MAGTCLICCVLIQVLLVTVYGESTNIAVYCPNQTGTMGEQLHLTCNVTCKNCTSTDDYKWSKTTDTDFKCSNESKRDITTGGSHIFNCTIPSASEKHIGTFKFWVQMKSGHEEKTFNVTIVTRVPNPIPTAVGSTSTVNIRSHREKHDKVKDPKDGRSPVSAMAVMGVFFLAICTIAVVVFKRKKFSNMSISALCTHRIITETEQI